MTIEDVPPHLQGVALAAFQGSIIINALPTSRFSRRGTVKNIWPHLTDDERRLILGASLLTEQGVYNLGEIRVRTWGDKEIWVHDRPLTDKIITVINGRYNRSLT